MLKTLYIKNYAIIDEIKINFEKGFTVITGETGAGKSILVGALSLIAGDRSDINTIKNKLEKCIVEASFEITDNSSAQQFLKENELLALSNDYLSELIIRREIASNGKSRVFINDTPSTLSVLTPLSALLLDLHRQFDTLELQYHTHQLNIVDTMAGHQELQHTFEGKYNLWKKSDKAFQDLLERNRIMKQELDYNNFLFNEIESLQLRENEIEKIESEISLLEQTESYKQNLQNALMVLYENETTVLSGLKQVLQNFDPYTALDPRIAAMHQRLKTCYIEINDLQPEIAHEYENLFYDAEKISVLSERLNEANRLLQKHGVRSTEMLLHTRDLISDKILQAHTATEQEDSLKEISIRCREECFELAAQLSENRKKQIPAMETLINKLLKKVGMPNASFRVSVDHAEISKTGSDKIEFLFDANKTGQYKSVSKVASGGELSRLMLCIKSMLAGNTQLPTLFFDEIDSGISGETAIQVGNIMKQLSGKHQLISITHLPQIAGKAHQHLYIFKKENANGDLNTFIKTLNDEERVDILAEMLSGKDRSVRAKEMVRELMK